MGIRKFAVAVAVGLFVVSGAVFAQDEDGEEGVGEEAVEEEVAAPAPVAAPVVAAVPAPVVEAAPAPVAAAAPAAKPETKVDFYGQASYRFRGRLWSATNAKDESGSSLDYLNLLGWAFGAKVKVDDKLSLQFQIGNDLNAGESVTWANNKAPQGRAATDNLYVHLAYATWNPGPVYLSGGVIPVVSNGTLDLLERSISTGSYGDAIFQTWSTQTTNSLIAIKLGAPLVKEGVKVNVELTSSVIDPRTQTLIKSIGTTGARGVDASDSLVKEPAANPTSALFIVDIPVVAGDFKVTPQITYVLNRNFNSKLEKGDDELLYGLALNYKVNDGVSVNGNFGAGSISNENSLAGSYGNTGKTSSDTAISNANKYVSNGLAYGIGSTIKAGPGAIAIGFSGANSYNGADKYTVKVIDTPATDSIPEVSHNDIVDPKTLTNKNDYLIDIRYTWNIHPKFSIAPRWRTYITTYDEGSGHVKSKMENRPELILTGSF